MRIYRKNWVLLNAFLFTFSVIGMSPVGAQVSDDEVATAVKTELQSSDLVAYGRIELTVKDGIVELTGSAPSITALRQIEDVASTVRGVRSIVNRMDLEAAATSVEDLHTAIENSLQMNPATDLYQVDVSVMDGGAVVLDGSVDSWAEYDLAETVVGTVEGVRSIDNRIAVDASGHIRGAGEIQSDIAERLRWDARVDDSLISILVRDGGRVTLSGTVGSLAEKRLAASLAQVSGTRSVDASHLDVEPWARDEDRRLGADRGDVTDEEIRDAITSALSFDPRVASSDIDLTVVNGEVWLRGATTNLTARRAAEGVARNTRGTRRIHNFLAVDPTALEDSELLRQLMDSLATVDAYQQNAIDIVVEASRATIYGDVDSVSQYQRIDDVVANTRGVASLTNNLTIRGERPLISADLYMGKSRILMPKQGFGEEPVTDRSLYQEVESELFWSPFVDENAIEIEVDNGTVTLAGHVDSASELMAAAANAYEAGALIVNNELEIE